MHYYSSRANTALKSFFALTDNYVVASSSMQGWRLTMEDGHTIIVNGQPDSKVSAYLGVFDGHGGPAVANYVTKNLHHAIADEIFSMEASPRIALKEAFLKLDRRMQESLTFQSEQSGSTAVVVIICKQTLYCANLGDSRAVAYAHNEVLPLSYDHKPNNQLEVNRILRAGGFIAWGRVNGDMAMSRAFGDFIYKGNPYRTAREQIISSYPDVMERKIDTSWEFVVLACDGIWDVMSNEAACAFVKKRIDRKMKLSIICEQLLEECLCNNTTFERDAPGMDNMTVIILVFKNSFKKPYQRTAGSAAPYVHYVCTANGDKCSHS